MPKMYFDLVPKLLEGQIYIDISRDEIERILRQDTVFDRTFEVTLDDPDAEVPVRVVVRRQSEHLESISLALLVHEIRIAGIDFELKFDDMDGRRRRGWHKHIWDPVEEDADGYKVAIDCFDGTTDLREWLIRAFKELGIQPSGKDYGEPTLQFD